MKNPKRTLKLSFILLLLVFVSCKKSGSDAPQEPDDIAASELVDYYIAAEHKFDGNKLIAIYFTKEGNTVKAHGHIQGGYQIRDVVVKNRSFSIDYYGDKKSIYNFKLEKDDQGKLRLKSYEFKFNGSDNQLSFALLTKKADLPLFTNDRYKMIRSNVPFENVKDGIALGMNVDHLLWLPGANFTPVYPILNFAFKSTDDDYLGIAVPSWNGISSPIVLIEINDLLFISARQ